MSKLNEYEEFALGQYLSCWPEDTDFEDIIAAMSHDDDQCNSVGKCNKCEVAHEVGAWEPFEDHDYGWLAAQIVSMKDSLAESFVPRQKIKCLLCEETVVNEAGDSCHNCTLWFEQYKAHKEKEREFLVNMHRFGMSAKKFEGYKKS